MKKSLYDSYIKAFRWASDRIAKLKDGGIVGFISNGAWIDGNAQDGMRKCLQDEFTSIYVFNLRGNARTSGEQRRKESGSVFGEGTRTPITITLLVKNPAKKQEKAKIYYHDIGDYLTREQKLSIIKDFRSINNVEWKIIHPNEKNDWINVRDGLYDSLVPVASEAKKITNSPAVFNNFSAGVMTNRESWVYNSSLKGLNENIKNCIRYYNSEVDRIKYLIESGAIKKEDIQESLQIDPLKIKWDAGLYKDASNFKTISFDTNSVVTALYRPYFKQNLYFNKDLNWSRCLQPQFYPTQDIDNKLICVCGVGGNKEFSVLISNIIADRQTIANDQCFPLYWYEENKNRQKSLFDEETGEDYIRRDGITDWILKEVRSRYGTREITKEMIFYYVYGLLHSEDYRQRFAADLKKSLPRIPIVERVEDFMDFYKYGKKLADLHLNYEDIEPYSGVIVKGDKKLTGDESDYEYFRVWDKMRFKSKDDKSTIIYNGNITIENIPQKAYEYIVNGKSAIEWIVERYCVSQDKKSLIKNDANDWGKEHGKPRYILDLLLSVINVSVQTVDIVKALPKLKFD